MYTVDTMENNKVNAGDKTFEISKVKPVQTGSAKVDVPAASVAESDQRPWPRKTLCNQSKPGCRITPGTSQ